MDRELPLLPKVGMDERIGLLAPIEDYVRLVRHPETIPSGFHDFDTVCQIVKYSCETESIPPQELGPGKEN